MKRRFLTNSMLAVTAAPPPSIETVAGVAPLPGFSRLTALKERSRPATSKCTPWPPGLASKDVFTMTSGARLGTFGLFTPVVLLVLLLLLSNSWLYVALAELNTETELGRVCCGFSIATPSAQLFVG